MHKFAKNLSISQDDGRWLTLRSRIKKSDFRSQFLLDKEEIKYLYDKGLEIVKNNAFDFFRNHLASVHDEVLVKHVPLLNHPVFMAQQATATCCRECIAKWHDISPLNELSQEEIFYLVDIAMLWLCDNIPEDVPDCKQFTLF